jgi:hypothetical protein
LQRDLADRVGVLALGRGQGRGELGEDHQGARAAVEEGVVEVEDDDRELASGAGLGDPLGDLRERDRLMTGGLRADPTWPRGQLLAGGRRGRRRGRGGRGGGGDRGGDAAGEQQAEGRGQQREAARESQRPAQETRAARRGGDSSAIHSHGGQCAQSGAR